MDIEHVCRSPFRVYGAGAEKFRKEMFMKKDKTPVVISFRKTCRAEGTGLSHYILMDRKGK